MGLLLRPTGFPQRKCSMEYERLPSPLPNPAPSSSPPSSSSSSSARGLRAGPEEAEEEEGGEEGEALGWRRGHPRAPHRCVRGAARAAGRMIAAQLLAYYFTELKEDQVKKVRPRSSPPAPAQEPYLVCFFIFIFIFLEITDFAAGVALRPHSDPAGGEEGINPLCSPPGDAGRWGWWRGR